MTELTEEFRVLLDTTDVGIFVKFSREELLRLVDCVRYTNNPTDSMLLERLQVAIGYDP